MKESKFVELLNLYIDQEISPSEADLLEKEIQRDPARRRVYLQYCRMHRASAVLFASFRSENVPAGSKLAEAARAADEKVVAFPTLSPHRSARWVYAAGLVAAACVAFVFVRRSAVDQTRPGGSTQLTQNVAVPVQPVAAQPAAVAPETYVPAGAPMTRREFTPVFVARSLATPEMTPNAAALLATNRATLDWIHQIRLTPVQNLALENLVFQTQPALPQDQRIYRSTLPVQGNAEKASFEFQR